MRRLFGAALVTAVAGSAVFIVAASPAAAAPQTETISFRGEPEDFTGPHVCRVDVAAAAVPAGRARAPAARPGWEGTARVRRRSR